MKAKYAFCSQFAQTLLITCVLTGTACGKSVSGGNFRSSGSIDRTTAGDIDPVSDTQTNSSQQNVESIDTSSNEAQSQSDEVVIRISPDTPMGLESFDQMPHSFRLLWTPSSQSAFYSVAIDAGSVNARSCGNTNLIGRNNYHSFINLAPNSIYTVTVCSLGIEGESSQPAKLEVQTAAYGAGLAPSRLPAPKGLRLTKVEATAYAFEWEPAPSIAGYYVTSKPGTSAASCDHAVNTGLQPSYRFTSQAPNSDYVITVCSYDSYGRVSAAATLPVRTVQN